MSLYTWLQQGITLSLLFRLGLLLYKLLFEFVGRKMP
jgi:hypothetical protein